MRALFAYPVPPPRLQVLRYQQGIGSHSAVLREALEDGRDPSGIANLWVRRGDRVTRNGLRPLIRFLRRVPVTRTKSVWNLWRRVRAKAGELAARLDPRRRPRAA